MTTGRGMRWMHGWQKKNARAGSADEPETPLYPAAPCVWDCIRAGSGSVGRVWVNRGAGTRRQ